MILGAQARDLRRDPRGSDPTSLCKALGIDSRAKRQAGGLLVCCPVHQEKDPSCSVTRGPDGTIRVRCHACGWSADALGLVAVVHGLDVRKDFREVLSTFAALIGRHDVTGEIASRERVGSREPARSVAATVETVSDARFDEIARALIELCPLRDQPDVRSYVEGRHVYADAEANDCAALPKKPQQHAIVAELVARFGAVDLDRAGLCHNGMFVYADHRLVIPWRDRAFRIEALQRRLLVAAKKKYVWSRGRSPKAPFGSDLFVECANYFGGDFEVIVCEGALDTFARRKIARHRDERAIVLGVPSASESADGGLLELVRNRVLRISVDPDAAGERAAQRIGTACLGSAKKILRERAKSGKDCNEVLLAILRREAQQ